VSNSDCIIGSNAKDSSGYPRFRADGKIVKVARYQYCKANGLALADIEGQHVLHSCDNRACINPAHLRIGTNADNVRDRVERDRSTRPIGEANPKAKLTAEDVKEIRSSNLSNLEIAIKYGITKGAASKIKLGRTWATV